MLEAGAPARHTRSVLAPWRSARLAEFVTDDVALPRFHVWTLGCQMNHSDSEEMAGALLAAGCREAPAPGVGRPHRHQHLRHPRGGRAEGHRPDGPPGAAKQANPALRVVLTGCSVRADNAADAASAATPRSTSSCDPTRSRSCRTAWLARDCRRCHGALARARAAPGDVHTAAPNVARRSPGWTRICPAARSPQCRGTVARRDATHAWLPIIYGCDKTCTYCIVPFSRGPERSRPFDDVVAEARSLAAAGYHEVTLLGQNVNSYGHDLPPEPRFADVRGERTLGRQLALDGRPDIAALLRAIDGLRTADGVPAIPRLRFVTSHPWDLTDRLIAAMAECPSVCEHLHLPVQSGDDAVLRRMGRQYTVAAYLELVERLRAGDPRHQPDDRRDRRLLRRDRAAVRGHARSCCAQVRFDQVFAAAFSPRPGTPAARLPDDVSRADKRRRLNRLLELQEGIGLERNQSWLGRTTEVLVEEQRPAPSPRHERRTVQASAPDGRNREHRLVHFDGPAELVGRRVPVPVERAGPYALSGSSGRITPDTSAARRSSAPDRHRRRRPPPARPPCRSALAAQLPGAEIISADSRQVYRGMDIGTAKVDAADARARAAPRPRPGRTRRALHRRRLPPACDAGTRRDRVARGGTAILVGGTGLFVNAIAAGVPLEEAGFEPAVRASLEERLLAHGLGPLVEELRSKAPGVAGSVDLANPRRVVRALERVAVHGDRPPPAPRGYPNSVEWHVLDMEPVEQARRIAERATWQFANGLLEEAAVLRSRYPENLRAFSAVGYREAFDVLAGRCSTEEAVDRAILRTRQYARRQRTWFRRRPVQSADPKGRMVT